MGVVLALGAAVAYGASDFLAGVLSRRVSSFVIAAIVQLGASGSVVLAALLVHGGGAGGATPVSLAWGALSGLGNGLGTVFLYRGLGSGRMSVVAPLSAVSAAGLPVLVGFATGERPSLLAALGILLAAPAIWLVSRSTGGDTATGRRSAGVVAGLLAGVAFGFLFVALGRVPAGTGLWPLACGQIVSVPVILTATLLAGRHAGTRSPGWWRPGPRIGAGAVLAGLLGAAANLLYLFATHQQLVSVSAVITSLYPAFTVLAALVLLRERVGTGQAVGLAAAAGAVALIALG